jgi:putative cardiolipin synthase
MWLSYGCATISFDQPKNASYAIVDVTDTTLAKSIAAWTREHGGNSGFYPLIEGMDALGVRLYLAEQAEKSIDLQYFLMKDDSAGMVISAALLKAADRGVRVRFLLDDVFTTAPDRILMLLNQHPKIEIRIFNPISRSGIYSLNFLGDFRRANRRMHNKSFTVDNSASIVGGRNIADEYFQLKTDSMFIDLDTLAVGPVVADISSAFDEFWNHALALPVEQLVHNKTDERLADFVEEVREEVVEIADSIYRQAVQSELLQDLIADRIPLFPAQGEVIFDSPDKLTTKVAKEQMRLARHLGEVIRNAEQEVMFITPYYVPGVDGLQFAREMVDRGIRIVIVTNSLASTNHVTVHAGYTGYRRSVIEAGVELYEARANATAEIGGDTSIETLTLHTKAILIDRRRLFIGSLNLDPRSIQINAEMGLLIHSEEMTDAMSQGIEKRITDSTYRVLLNEDGDLEWHAYIGNERVVETKEPLTSWWLRAKAWFLKIAPESQL